MVNDDDELQASDDILELIIYDFDKADDRQSLYNSEIYYFC